LRYIPRHFRCICCHFCYNNKNIRNICLCLVTPATTTSTITSVVYHSMSRPLRHNARYTCRQLSCQPLTMPDFNSSVRPSMVWICYPEPETPWNFTPHSPTLRQRYGYMQTRSTHPFRHRPFFYMDDGARLLESCLDKTTSYSRCVWS